MYKNILVGIDPAHGDEQTEALRMALRLADDANSRVTAITVIEPIPATVMAEAPADYGERAAGLALANLRKLAGERSEVSTVIRHGKPGPSIVDYAKEQDVDCIVIASHKPGLSDYFLGSTAGRVVRHASCSVHVMR